jgi:hypothetical protein
MDSKLKRSCVGSENSERLKGLVGVTLEEWVVAELADMNSLMRSCAL